MTERGLPIVDGAPACPFVAFDDDRDERAASPDHRHRCYAEPQPAPRALAHQEAYCLSSAFPVCPTFQDWARREAARSRMDPPRAPEVDSVAAAAAAVAPQRNPPRNWAAPPPWAARGDARTAPGGEPDEEDGGDRADEAAAAGAAAVGPAADVPPRGRGLSGSFADRVASDPGVPGLGHEPVVEDDDEQEEDERAPVGEVPPYAPPSRSQSQAQGQQPAPWAGEEEDEGEDMPPPEPPRRRREREERMAAYGGGPVSPRPPAGGQRHERRRDPHAPEWERARPLEAYPTLRSRRLSGLSIPPILVAVVALALAAAVLFALPGLLGFGSPSAGQTTRPTGPAPTPVVTPAGPTAEPKPTEQIYVVKAGDTLSRIAGRFGIPLEDLIAANAETLPNPDKLQIGDQLIIPAPNPDELPAASEIPAAN